MGFRTVYGRTHSENGWRMCDYAQCDNNPIPGTSVRIPLQRGHANIILKAFAADLNRIEPVMNARGGTDEGGWTNTNEVASSNHLSGTAFDYNWSDHAFRVSYDGWTSEEIRQVRALLDFYEGIVFWGQDWTNPRDSMHFQMNRGTANDPNRLQDFINRKIRADGFSTFKAGPKDPDAFPLPVGYCWGPLDGPEWSVSGLYEGTPKAWKDGLKRWQKALGLVESGVWDGATEAAATALQKDKGWPPVVMDRGNGEVTFHGCVFEGEWDAVIRKGWRLTPATPPNKKFPDDYSDRELLIRLVEKVDYIELQMSEGHPDWDTFGTTLRDLAAGK
jgi:hypothetical protein